MKGTSSTKGYSPALNRKEMRKLAAGQKITENGITYERKKNGDGIFSINIMVDGQRIHRVIGRESDGTTKTQAEELIAKLRTDAKHERLSLPRGRKISMSFAATAEKYLERLAKEGGKDLKMKTARLKLHLVPFFGNMPLSRISSSDVERYKDKRKKENSLRGGDRVSAKAKAQGASVCSKPRTASEGTINRELAVLSHLFKNAAEWKWLTTPSPKIVRFKEDGNRITYLTVEQVKRLLDCARESDSPHIYPFIMIGVETAMRTTEILSMQKEHVDIAKRTIHIPKSKTGMREQPMTQHLANFLKDFIAASDPESPWLFPSTRSASGHITDIRDPFVKAVQAAGLDPTKVVRHTLRHTAITHLVQAGVDLPTVQRISGHKTIEMVLRYSHQSGDHIREAMDVLENRLKLA